MLAMGKIAWVQTDAFKCITSIHYYFNFTTNISFVSIARQFSRQLNLSVDIWYEGNYL